MTKNLDKDPKEALSENVSNIKNKIVIEWETSIFLQK